MRLRVLNKKGEEQLNENLVFIIANAIFICAILWFIYATGSSEGIAEDLFAKKIALMIDVADPGSVMTLDVSVLREHALNNHYQDSLVSVEGNSVFVKVSRNSGNRFGFFNDVNVDVVELTSNQIKLVIGEKND